jgi:hypothetical protein
MPFDQLLPDDLRFGEFVAVASRNPGGFLGLAQLQGCAFGERRAVLFGRGGGEEHGSEFVLAFDGLIPHFRHFVQAVRGRFDNQDRAGQERHGVGKGTEQRLYGDFRLLVEIESRL